LWNLLARLLACAGLLLLAVVVEGAWGWRMNFAGGALEPVVVVVLAVGVRTVPELAALVGLAAGLLQDLAGGHALGLAGISKLLLGFWASTAARTVALDSPWASSALAAAGTAGSRAVEAALRWLAGEPAPALLPWAGGVAVSSCYNALVAPLVFAGFQTVKRWPRRMRRAAPSRLAS